MKEVEFGDEATVKVDVERCFTIVRGFTIEAAPLRGREGKETIGESLTRSTAEETEEVKAVDLTVEDLEDSEDSELPFTGPVIPEIESSRSEMGTVDRGGSATTAGSATARWRRKITLDLFVPIAGAVEAVCSAVVFGAVEVDGSGIC